MRLYLILPMMLLVGCASVPLEDASRDKAAKQFRTPPSDQSGVYIFRTGIGGAALKKDIWINGHCLGESATDTFFHTMVTGDSNHTLSTESEFSPNHLKMYFQGGKNYFFRQSMKMGLLVGGSILKPVTEHNGKQIVSNLKMAKPGNCKSRPPRIETMAPQLKDRSTASSTSGAPQNHDLDTESASDRAGKNPQNMRSTAGKSSKKPTGNMSAAAERYEQE